MKAIMNVLTKNLAQKRKTLLLKKSIQGRVYSSLKLTSIISLAYLVSACSPSENLGSTQFVNEAGSDQAQIVGGTLASSQLQKQNGIVQLKISSLQGVATCTGSLIEKNIVLTAAHCLADPTITDVAVLFGLDDKSITQDQVIFGISGKVHESFKPTDDKMKVWNDIALLKLEKDAPVDFKLAQLPAADRLPKLDRGSKLMLAGFGITNALVRKVVKDKKGQQKIVELPSTGDGVLRQVDQIVVTAVSLDKKEITLDQTRLKGACHGDSGGPAYLKQSDGTLLLVGVTSRGTEKLGNCNAQAVYSGVSGHLTWISDNTKALLQSTQLAAQ